MTLGEFYCKGLTAPVMVEIKRDDVVFARVYDIRGQQHLQPAGDSGALIASSPAIGIEITIALRYATHTHPLRFLECNAAQFRAAFLH